MPTSRYRIGSLIFREQSGSLVRPDGAAVMLSQMESVILGLLCRRRGRPVAGETLRMVLYGHLADPRSDSVIRAHVCRLRRKLGADAAAIVTRKGWGYTIAREACQRLADEAA